MISVIIPNYNGSENIKKNLPRIIKSLSRYDFEIVISDDKSQDDSVAVINNISKEFKGSRIKLIESRENKGFSTNVNRAVANSVGEILVLLNTDVYPENDFLAPVLDDLKRSDVFAVGFMDKSIEEGKIVLRGRGVGGWNRGFLVHSAGELNKNTSLWASGGSSAFKKDIWKKLGGLNELYDPFYWEDIDLSYRALKSGYKILFEKKAIVVHEHDKGIIKNKFSKSKIKRIAFRNQLLFVWINGTKKQVLLNILWLPYNMLKSISYLDYEFILSFFSAFLLLPKVISSRIRVQKYFVKKDKEFIVKE